MPQRFISGMDCTYPSAAAGGRFMHRLMVEWLTQVVGWGAHDLVGSNWNNVAASGSGSADTTDSKTIEITSGGYAFSTADEGSYLTITGFSAPYEARDGIYRIRKYLGSAGSVYTLEVHANQGVHSDGFPVDTGMDWRLWEGNDSYCPTSTSDVAVLTGRGKTGAGLADGQGTGDSFSLSGSTITFTDAAANFQTHDVGKEIIIAGATTPGNDGTFTIVSRISTTQVTYTNASGATEAFTGTWQIRYDYHVYMQCNSWDYGYGGLRGAPWASWNNVTHGWDDNRYTSLVSPSNAGGWMHRAVVWAEADENHFTFAVLTMQVDGDWSTWMFYAAGEFKPFYPEYDPRPIWVYVGNDTGLRIWSNPMPVIGYHSQNYLLTFYYGIKGLAYDDLTTVTYYQMMPNVPSSLSRNWIAHPRRKVSMYSRQAYRIPIVAEGRTSGYMELRGTIRDFWYCNNALPLEYPLGASGEYIHAFGGIMMPWNGARSAFPLGQSQVG